MADKYLQALSQLLPPGWAFPRHSVSTVMSVLAGQAGMLSDFDEYADESVRQWIPITTCSRLDEWETALGLPDQCFGYEQTVSQRTDSVLARLQGDMDLVYDDSSADSAGSIKAYMARNGFTVDVFYNIPFRVGRNHVSDALGALSGVLNIRLRSVCTPFQAGGRIGKRLLQCTKDTEEALCLLKKVVPARFDINLLYF